MPELIISISDQQLVPNLRRVIRSLHGVDRVYSPRHRSADTHNKNAKRTAHSETYYHQIKRLDELAALKKGWDDGDAMPLERMVVDNARKIIAGCEDKLSGWILFPDINGTIQLKAKGKQAVISLGVKDYSYLVNTEKVNSSASNCPLNISDVLKLIDEINQ